ncbi:MAG: hypothetical protein V1816_15900 [Pseudomonadota bacterium]
MKPFVERYSFVLLILAALSLGLGCSGLKTVPTDGVRQVSLKELKQNPGDLADLANRMKGGGELIIMAARGETLPLVLKIDLPFAAVPETKTELVVVRDMYLYLHDQGLLISPDRESWAAVGDWDAIKKLFPYDQGELSLGFAADKDGGSSLRLLIGTK